MAYLGYDIGTSSLKIIVVTDGGEVAHRATEHYSTARASGQYAEQDLADWISALRRCIASIPDPIRKRVVAIGSSSHVPTLVTVTADGAAVRPALIWQDNRAGSEARELQSTFGDSMSVLGTSLPWAPSHLPAKALWLARHHPEDVAATRWLMQPKDAVNLWLTGVASTDRWASKGLVNVVNGAPAQPVLAAIGWSESVIPPVTEPWDVIGTLRATVAASLGLGASVLVATGWTDAMAAVLAAGAFDAPSGVVLTGTSEIVGASSERASSSESVYLVPREVAPLSLSYGPTQASGASFAWVCSLLGLSPREALTAAESVTDEVPLFLPYIDGERSPVWDTDVRGLFLGLDNRHTHAHLVRSVLEGVAMSARHVLEAADDANGSRASIVNVGGRAIDHPAWLAARSGALGRTLHLHQEDNLSALGAAMTAALASGARMDEISALRASPRVVEPDPTTARRWSDRYSAYIEATHISHDWKKFA